MLVDLALRKSALKTIPIAPVVVPLIISDPTEATFVAPLPTGFFGSLTFSPSAQALNSQCVTVRGLPDTPVPVDDGNVPYTVKIGPALSLDLRYNGLDPGDLSAENRNVDQSGPVVREVNLVVSTGTRKPVIKSLVLVFSEPVRPSDLSNMNNYGVSLPGRNRAFDDRDSSDDIRITLSESPQYFETNQCLRLPIPSPIKANQLLKLVVSAAGVHDLAGNALDGDRDGLPGGDIEFVIGYGNRFSIAHTDGSTQSFTHTRNSVVVSPRILNMPAGRIFFNQGEPSTGSATGASKTMSRLARRRN